MVDRGRPGRINERLSTASGRKKVGERDRLFVQDCRLRRASAVQADAGLALHQQEN